MKTKASVLLGALFLVGIAAGCFAAGAEAPPPPVYFHDVDMFIDAAVYDTIAQSSFLKEQFSGFQERTTQRDNGAGPYSYSFVGIRGRQTYLGIFKPPLRPKGWLTFNLWVDDRTKLPLIRDSLARETLLKPEIRPSKVLIGGRSITQFDSTQAEFAGETENLPLAATKVISLYPDFLRQAFPDIKPEQEGTTRDKERARQYEPGRLLNDITRFTFTADKTETEHLLQEFRAYGYAITTDGAKRIATGPEIEFVLLPIEPGAARKLAIGMKLNRPKPGEQSFQFADSELRFNGDTATWYFPAGWRP